MAHSLFFAFVVTVAVLLATFQTASATDTFDLMPMEMRCYVFKNSIAAGNYRELQSNLDNVNGLSKLFKSCVNDDVQRRIIVETLGRNWEEGITNVHKDIFWKVFQTKIFSKNAKTVSVWNK